MLAIAGGKGGCGKTTTALGLARALAAGPATPLVVDADRDMPTLHRLAETPDQPGTAGGERVDTGRTDERAAPTPAESIADLAVPSRRFPGVSIVPSSVTGRVDEVLRRSRSWEGPVLVDCPAGASPDATLPMRVADGTVLVTTTARRTIEDAIKTAEMAEALDAPPIVAAVRADGDPPLDGIGSALGCANLVRIPERDPRPLEHRAVGRAFDELSRTIDRERSRPESEPVQSSQGGRDDRRT